MDQLEFSIAIHLVRKKLQGVALPKVLPASLKADPGKPGQATTSPVQQASQQQQASAAHTSQAAAAAEATSPPQTAKSTSSATVCSPPLSKLLFINVIIMMYRICVSE